MTIVEIANLFAMDEQPLAAEPYGCGHINDTYCVTSQNKRYILQRINHNVFPNVAGLMDNIQRVTDMLREQVLANGGDPDRECLQIIPTKDGKSYLEFEGNYYRMYVFVERTLSLQTVEDPVHFYYSAVAFGRFQKQLASFPAETLCEVIPNFHNTASRYAAFEAAVARDAKGRAAEVQQEIEFVRARKADTEKVVALLESGELPLRVTHNDTKLNNVLLDDETGKPMAVIDLDTVMPGSSLYDFGDSIRFGTNPCAEDEKDLSKVFCQVNLFEEYTKGYLEACGDSLTAKEKELLPFGGYLMTLECGIRFLTDYLDGDTYFKIHYPEQNLDRCHTQFKLAADIMDKMDELNAIVKKYDK
ncbi:MAG: aminoglycoside phosphotransferase family protein [Clostridia bacterium]|nr:aminoglycoside phosphotransferase family protein [Clostridia bacterium]